MRTSIFSIIFLAIIHLSFGQGKNFISSKDVFGYRVFIENKGQFKASSNGKVPLYMVDQSCEQFAFTRTGFSYTYIENFDLDLKTTEEIKRRKLKRKLERQEYNAEMIWLNTNENVQIVAEEKQDHFISFGDKEFQSRCFKKIVYKDIYKNIDIEYIIKDEEDGRYLKYNIILHPGANYKDVKFKYTGNGINATLDAFGELQVRGVKQLISESKPVVITEDNGYIEAGFVQKEDVFQFRLKGISSTVNKKIIIDPWINSTGSLLNNTYAYEIDYDNAGNTYVYGGTPPLKLAKYNAAGALQWTFPGSVASVGWNYSMLMDGFCVNKTTGRVYVAGSVGGGAGIVGLNTANGLYDNFITAPFPGMACEIWRIRISPFSNDIIAYCGGLSPVVANVNQVTAAYSVGFTPTASATGLTDVTDARMDPNGESYYYRASSASAPTTFAPFTNCVYKMNPPCTNTLWVQYSTYPVMTEAANWNNYQNLNWPMSFFNSGAYNCLAVNCSNYFFYDGTDLAAYDKLTGVKIASLTIAGNSLLQHGGIAVDECNNIYVGANNAVQCYKLMGTNIISTGQIAVNATTTTKDVYDVAYNPTTNMLHICGSGFAGTFNAINSSTCSSALAGCFMQLPSYSMNICPGTSTIITVGNPNNIQNPTYSLQPGSQTSSNNTFVVSPTVPTTYTVYVSGTINSSVVTQSATVSVGFFPAATINPSLTNGTCANPVTSSVNLNVTFNPPISTNYTVNWTPIPASYTSVNTSTASGLTPGVNNLTVTTANGCTNVVSFTVPPVPIPASFVIVNPSNDYTVTCMNPNVLLTTSVTNGNPLSYTWFPSCSNTLVASSMNFSQSCTGQVVGTSTTGCVHTETFTIYQDLTTPSIAITPSVQNVTCIGGSGCFTLTSNLHPNVTTNWFQIVGTSTMYVGAAQGTINIFCAGAPGIYWGESVYNVTGCKVSQSVQVTASVGVPVFTVTSPTNFTIGCGSKSITSMQVTSVITSPVPNVAVNYTFMTPPVTGTPTTFTINPNLNGITIPGTYVVYVKDLTNNCVSSQSISIIQNTIAPTINFLQPLSQLTCKDFSMVLTGISSNTNTNITWTVPAFPGSSVNPTPNATVNINSAITGATNNVTAIGVWTVGAVDNNNFCSASKTVQINQDIRLPKFTISALSNSVITCKNSDVVIVPIVTPSLAAALVPTYIWYPPVGPGIPGTQFNTTAPGTHTAISTSVVNGCTYVATYNVAVDRNAPALEMISTPYILDCNTNPTVVITPSITGSTTGFTYSWTVPAGAITSNLTSSVLISNKIGFYFVTVTNTLNGCAANALYEVAEGGINASFIPDNDFGFVPMTVNFQNTSSTSTGASSIISTWGYGNGAVTQTVLNTIPGKTTYTAAGTYSVVLKVQKGTCIDTAMRIITVELASQLEIPNVFTPNADKVNDIFRLRASSLNEVYIIIYDRWGNMVYEVTSDTGNFGWDGKNQAGKECPDGTYFYILKAKGKDAREYDIKGNVSLFR